MSQEKGIIWVKSSLEDLKELPTLARRDIGFALSEVQQGNYPSNAKPLKGFKGVHEIRSNVDSNTYRAAYVVNLGDYIYVLHAFQKKSKKGVSTPKRDIDVIRQRLKYAQILVKELQNDYKPS